VGVRDGQLRERIRTTREARGRVSGDGVELAYGMWPGAGTPLLALHGITASYVNFIGVADRLAGRRPLLALDLRGRGDSDKPDGPYGMVQHAHDTAAAMRAFGLGPTVVVGHSMGAYVAVALAAEYPDLVAGLVLVDGGLPLKVPPGVEIEALLDVVLAAQLRRLSQDFPSVEAYLDFWRGLPALPPQLWNPWVEAYLSYDLGGTAPALRPKAFEAGVRADYRDSSNLDVLRQRLAGLRVPVVLLRAEEGFEPGQPPLIPDTVVAAESGVLSAFTERMLPGTTHYSIALGEYGAGVVADTAVGLAEAGGR